MRPFGHGCHLKDEKIEGRKNEGMKKIIILPIKTITIIYNKFNHHICLLITLNDQKIISN